MIFGKPKKRSVEEDKKNLLVNLPSSSRFAESYRTLRTNIFFSAMEKEIKSVVITSSVEKEGKTTTALNLAYTIAQTDRKVLLMDCDFRRPHLTKLSGGKLDKGITEIATEVLGIRHTKGDLDTCSISDLILLTRLQQRSCCLDIENSDTQVAVYFENGLMTDIYWKNRPASKQLINTLVRDKLLTEKESDLALSHQKKSVQNMENILYTMGFLTKKEISKAMAIHAIEAIRALSSIEEGQFAFTPISSGEKKAAIKNTVSLESLYAEFGLGDDRLEYIKSSIDATIKETETKGLYFLPSGAIPSNPSELIGSKRMEFLVDYLKKIFDFIIIDTPPVMPATDAIIMAPRTDGTILVMKSGNTERRIIQSVIDQFKAANQPIIGTVLNQVDMKKEGYYRYYNKYYSSYYGK